MITTKQNWLKRSLSLLLALMMCVSMVSVTAFASGNEQTLQEQLKDLVDEVNAMDSTLYTEDSWNALIKTVGELGNQNLLEVSDFVAEYYVGAITERKNALVLAAPSIQQQLKDLVDEINAMDSSLYTEDSWNALIGTVGELGNQNLLDVSDFVAEYYVGAITERKNALVLATAEQTPQQQLESLLDEIDKLNPDDYTAESWENLSRQAKSVVRPVKPYDETTEEGMPDWVAEYMIETLTKFRNELVPADKKSVYEKLEEKLIEAEAMNADTYTEDSWAAVQDIIDAVDRPVSAENITEKLASKLLSDLENALSALQEKPSEAITLEDGTYYAAVNVPSGISPYLADRAKIVAKDGNYKVTLYTITNSYSRFDGDYTSNRIYRRNDRSDWLYPMAEVVKPEYNAEFTKGDELFALKNLKKEYDLAGSGYDDGIKAKISAENDEKFFTSEYKYMSDNSLAFTFETNNLDGEFVVNGLYNVKYHNYDGTTKDNYWTMNGKISFDKDSFTPIPDSIVSLSGSYVKEESASNRNEAERNLSRHAGVSLEAKDGKIYATYSFDLDAFINYTKGVQSAEVYDENGSLMDVSDGTLTLVYESYDELFSGKYVGIQSQIVDESRGAYMGYNEYDFAVDFSAKPVTLTDKNGTGIKLYTTNRFVSEDAELRVKPVTENGKTELEQKLWANAMENIPKYNKGYFFTPTVTDGGKNITDFGGAVSIEVPKVEGLNDKAVRLFINDYMPEYDYMPFGWQNEDIVAHENHYSLLLDKSYFNGNWYIYDEVMSESDDSSLENGTYTVPITTFNQAQPTQTSMSAQCLGETATLVVKDGVIRLEMDYQPVDIGNMNGYLIQMWVQQESGEWKEVTYTAFYKNEDGSYFTDELNEGTNDYYPQKAYMILPTTDVQFITKFRVSAMDAIMGDAGDATRDAIFTIYYDEAVKISDDTPDAAPEEIPDFEPADMTKLEALVKEAEAYNGDEYTLSTFTTMKNALASAKTVLANSRATQEDVDSAVNELQTAIDALVKKSSPNDKNNLPDGKYILYAQMLKTDRESFSMSNNAINHNVWLEVINGEYYLTMQFKGLTIENRFGYLKNLSYYDAGYTYNDFGIPQGTLIPADVISTYDVVDMYNDAENPYPMLLKVKLVDKAAVQFVPLHVFVPIMEAIAEGTGDQDVLMQLDWDTLKEDSGDIKPEEPVEQSPAVDVTDAATGVKVHADKGVFEEGVQVVVTEITQGVDYDNVASALSDIGKKFKLYDVKFLDNDGNEVAPNGTVTISFPLGAGYNSDQLAVYRINDDGSKTLVKGAQENGMYKIITKTAAKYALVEKDSAITDEQNTQNVNNGHTGNNTNNGSITSPQTGDNSNFTLWFMLMFASAGMLAVLTFARKRKVNEGE